MAAGAHSGCYCNTSWVKASNGVLHPSRFRGRLLSEFSTTLMVSSDIVAKSVRFGKYQRMSPLVFSFVPLSHEWYGWAKYQERSSSVSIESTQAFSLPLSEVMVLLASDGRTANRLVIILRVVSAVMSLIFEMNTRPVFRSTMVFNPTLFCLETMESLSQCPTVFLRATSFGRSSMEMPLGRNTLLTVRIPF